MISNDQLIKQLSSRSSGDQNTAISYLFEVLAQKIQAFTLKNRGTKEDGKDVFQEALFVLLKKAQSGKLHEGINIQPYTFSICKYLWWKKLAKRDKSTNIDHSSFTEVYHAEAAQLIDERYEIKEKYQRLEDLMRRLGNDCFKILQLFYYNELKMREIAIEMNFANEQVAKNKKSLCMKKLRPLIQNASGFSEM